MTGSHVTVSVNQGTALIRGETQSAAQQQRAVDIAQAVKGLTQVQTEMRLRRGAHRGAREGDRGRSGGEPGPAPRRGQGCEVELYSDQTNAGQRARLRDIAGGIPGVTRVEDNMESETRPYRARASCAASSVAVIMLDGSATSLPAISNAVP